MAADCGMDDVTLLKPIRMNGDSVSRVRENRLHGLMRGRAALLGVRPALLLSLLYLVWLFRVLATDYTDGHGLVLGER
ncbi:MAG: hypothetical protein A3G75_04680 [Verrucomicrobia bacterium RIFCSPLOWO2_12_FULL_64_8]|nr:MAG: hypothetical protein A3G75_04680 [Verrucomicrobia bacterium RIFCSPLOWO2_12_FULL_64_8]